MPRRRLILLVSAAVRVLALAACGGSSSNGVASKPPGKILSSAVAAAKGASSVHLVGSITSGGQPTVVDFQFAEGGETKPGGQKVITVKGSKGGTLCVTTTGKSYPGELGKTGSDAGKITFDEWNAPVKLEAPKGAVDLGQITG